MTDAINAQESLSSTTEEEEDGQGDWRINPFNGFADRLAARPR
jgi:hypothetical protein